MIRTLPQPKGQKRDFFCFSYFSTLKTYLIFLRSTSRKIIFSSFFFFFSSAFTSLNVPGTSGQQASRVLRNTLIAMFLKKQ